MEIVRNVMKINYFTQRTILWSFPLAAELRGVVSVEALETRLTTLYDNMTEFSADMKVGDTKMDSPENLVFFGFVFGP